MVQMEQEINERIRRELKEQAEPQFQKFSSALIPGIPAESVIGVRLPKLRKMAKKIAKSDWRSYLENARDTSFEEVMLQGMVIGCAKAELTEQKDWIVRFLPKIDNWSVCDSFCSGLKSAKEYPEAMWEFVKPYLADTREYYIRFALVMLINYYVDEEHIEEALLAIDKIRHDSYYVKMAAAWAVSMYYVAYPKITLAYLDTCSLDDFTFHKSLQKIIESKQVDDKVREQMRRMKRDRNRP